MTAAVILVLLGSMTHATWNLVASQNTAGDSRLFVWTYSVASLVVLAPACAVVWVAGASLSWSLLFASMVSGVLHTAYGLALQAAYSRSDVNVTYPVARGVGPVLVAIIAVLVLGESLGWTGWLGIALITSGVAVVSTGVTTTTQDRSRRAAGVRWGLLVACTIASYTLWDAYAVTTLELDPVLYYGGTGASMFVFLTAVCARQLPAARALARQKRRAAAIVGALVPVSYILVLVALTMAPVSVIAPLRGTSIVLGSLAAWWWLGESHGGRRLVGATIVTVGVAALVLS